MVNNKKIKITMVENNFFLNSQEYNEIQREKNNYENPRAALIETLKIIQKSRGWISNDAIYIIANILKVNVSDVEEVATFYSQIFRKPVGRHIIRYCDSVVCYIKGYKKNLKVLENFLKIKPGQTTKNNRFTLLPTCCLGNCDKAASIMINEDTYGCVTEKNICRLLERYK